MKTLKLTIETDSAYYRKLYENDPAGVLEQFAKDLPRTGAGFKFSDYADSRIILDKGVWVVEDSITKRRAALPDEIKLSAPLMAYIGKTKTLAELEANDRPVGILLRKFYVNELMSMQQQQKLLPYVDSGNGVETYLGLLQNCVLGEIQQKLNVSPHFLPMGGGKNIIRRADGSYLFSSRFQVDFEDDEITYKPFLQINLSFVISAKGLLEEPLVLLVYDQLVYKDMQKALAISISTLAQAYPKASLIEATKAELTLQNAREAELRGFSSRKLALAIAILILAATIIVASLTAAALIPAFLPAITGVISLSSTALSLMVELGVGLLLTLPFLAASLINKPAVINKKANPFIAPVVDATKPPSVSDASVASTPPAVVNLAPGQHGLMPPQEEADTGVRPR